MFRSRKAEKTAKLAEAFIAVADLKAKPIEVQKLIEALAGILGYSNLGR